MRRYLCVVAAAIVLSAGCSKLFKGSFNWQTFTAPDGSFTVELPGKMKQETRQQGGLTITMYGAEVRNGVQDDTAHAAALERAARKLRQPHRRRSTSEVATV